MNAPPTFESFLLFDGEKKITKEQDTKVDISCSARSNCWSVRCRMLQYSPSIKRITQLETSSDTSWWKTRMFCLLDTKIPVLSWTRSWYGSRQRQTTHLRWRLHPIKKIFSKYFQDAFMNALTDLQSELSLFEERFREQLKEKRDGLD